MRVIFRQAEYQRSERVAIASWKSACVGTPPIFITATIEALMLRRGNKLANASSGHLSGGPAGRPCPLEVEAAEMARDIDDLTDKVQAGLPARRHRFG